jgi:D-arabinose 5-phosphate isomerase GutQ
MRLTVDKMNDCNATLRISDDDDGLIDISGANAPGLAMEIARAVNRDKHFDALVAALTELRSGELSKLAEMIDIREDGAEVAELRLSRLVSMIDVILDAVERTEQDDGIGE